MKTSRTRRHNTDGSIIYNTMNSTGLVNRYSNENPRFNSRNGVQVNPNSAKQGCSCSIAGCGKQCCLNTYLLSNIQWSAWSRTVDEAKVATNVDDTIALDYGLSLAPGGYVYVGDTTTSGNQLLFKTLTFVGTIKDIIFPNSSNCLAIGDSDCSGAFPIDIRILVNSESGSCSSTSQGQNLGIIISTALVPDTAGMTNQLWSAIASAKGIAWNGVQYYVTTDPSGVVSLIREKYEVLGVSRVGAPYRAPLAGFRKTLECCDVTGNCTEECRLLYGITDLSSVTDPALGDFIYLPDGSFFGEVVEVINPSPLPGYQATLLIKTPDPCADYQIKAASLSSGGIITFQTSGGGMYQRAEFISTDVTTCLLKPLSLNDVYKDPQTKSCQQDSRVCYDRRIRSGMQPKQQFCVEYVQQSNNTYKKHKRLLCPKDTGWQKPYSYSYSQYNKNRALNTYKRGLEKNLPVQDDPSSACPAGADCEHSLYPNTGCCLKSQYRKSGGSSCNCCTKVVCPTDTTVVLDVLDPVTIFSGPTSFVAGCTYTFTSVSADFPTGFIINGVAAGGLSSVSVSIGAGECDGQLMVQLSGSAAQAIGPITCTPCQVPSSKNAVTVWKPNNSKFKVQGAVSSGSRLERLKVDTLRAANSKCRKGQRCKDGTGKGPYFSGKPRFTGWMFNARHLERICMNKYRQQPFGIPQLTSKQRSTRSTPRNDPRTGVSWNPKTQGTYGLYQRDTVTARAPGCGNNCVADCPIPDCDGDGQRTFEEWRDIYLGTDNARYPGVVCPTYA